MLIDPTRKKFHWNKKPMLTILSLLFIPGFLNIKHVIIKIFMKIVLTFDWKKVCIFNSVYNSYLH